MRINLVLQVRKSRFDKKNGVFFQKKSSTNINQKEVDAILDKISALKTA